MDDKCYIKEKLKATLIKCNFVEQDLEIVDDSLLFADLGIDSLVFISLICDIESEFSIKFSEDDLIVNEDIKFGDMVDMISNLQKSKSRD